MDEGFSSFRLHLFFSQNPANKNLLLRQEIFGLSMYDDALTT